MRLAAAPKASVPLISGVKMPTSRAMLGPAFPCRLPSRSTCLTMTSVPSSAVREQRILPCAIVPMDRAELELEDSGLGDVRVGAVERTVRFGCRSAQHCGEDRACNEPTPPRPLGARLFMTRLPHALIRSYLSSCP